MPLVRVRLRRMFPRWHEEAGPEGLARLVVVRFQLMVMPDKRTLLTRQKRNTYHIPLVQELFDSDQTGLMSSVAGRDLAVTELKLRLLSFGLRIAPAASQELGARFKLPQRVRSGVSGGLDIVLPKGTWVNCPTNESFVLQSPFLLNVADGGFVVADEARDEKIPVDVPPRPDYVAKSTSDGTPMSLVGQISGDRLGIGLMSDCVFWRSKDLRCKFCSIGLNARNDLPRKSIDQILKTVDAAFSDPVYPARHVLLSGGTPEGPDMGMLEMARVAEEIRKRHSFPIYAMASAPLENRYIEMLRESGVDELALNLELFDEAAAEQIIPGKHRLIGKRRYLEALEYAVSVFGRINTRSILVVGLEQPDSTIQGAAYLASMGVMPILSPFRPLNGTELQDRDPPDPAPLMHICAEAERRAAQHGIPLGPTCIPCQNNTLTPPAHPAYCHY